MRQYKHQTILYLDQNLHEGHSNLLQIIERKHGGTPSLAGYDDLYQLNDKLRELDKNSRLYIFAHGDPEGKEVANAIGPHATNKYESWTPEQLAILLAKNLPKQEPVPQQNLFSKRLRISLVVCYGATPQNKSFYNSFAAKLQVEMKNRGFYVDIEARTGIVLLTPTGMKKTPPFDQIKLFETMKREKESANTEEEQLQIIKKYRPQFKNGILKHHQPNSKASFRFVKNEHGEVKQVVYESYALKKHLKQYEQAFLEIQEIVKELRQQVKEVECIPGHRPIANIAKNLAENIEKEAVAYFNDLNKTKNKTNSFKEKCFQHITTSENALRKHRKNQVLCVERFIDKLTAFIFSPILRAVPAVNRKSSIKKVPIISSATLFSDKIAKQTLPNKLRKIVGSIQPTHSSK